MNEKPIDDALGGLHDALVALDAGIIQAEIDRIRGQLWYGTAIALAGRMTREQAVAAAADIEKMMDDQKLGQRFPNCQEAIIEWRQEFRRLLEAYK